MVSIAPGQLRRLWCGGDRAGGHDGRQRHNHTHDLLTHTLPPHIDPRLTEPVVRIRAMPRAKPRSMARLVACAPLAPRPTTNPPAAARAEAQSCARAGPPPPSERASIGLGREKKKTGAEKAQALKEGRMAGWDRG